jgi:hypothetical protein
VGAGIEQESAAGEVRLLAPGALGQRAPVLPDGGADGQQLAQLAGAGNTHSLSDLRGEAAVECHDQQATGAVTRFD